MAGKSKIRPVIHIVLLGILFTIIEHFSIYFPWIGLEQQEKVVSATEHKKVIGEKLHLPHELNSDSLAKDFLLIDISNDNAVYCDSGRADSIGLPYDAGKRRAPCYA